MSEGLMAQVYTGQDLIAWYTRMHWMPRPVQELLPRPAPNGPFVGAAELHAFAAHNNKVTEYRRASRHLHDMVVESLGTTIQARIQGMEQTDAIVLPVHAIVARMTGWYGGVTTSTLADLKSIFRRPLTSPTPKDFLSWRIAFEKAVTDLARANAVESTSNVVEQIHRAMQTLPVIMHICTRWQRLHPDIAAQTPDSLLAYIEEQLPIDSLAASANAALATDMQARLDRQDAQIASLLLMATANASTGHQPPVKAAPPKKTGARASAYCYFHGTAGHPGSACTIMQTGQVPDRDGQGRKTGTFTHTPFTARMKAATCPTDVPAGTPPGRA